MIRNYIVAKVNIPLMEIQLFGTFLNIKIKGKSLGNSIFQSEKSRAIFKLLILKKISDNTGLISTEINDIFWPKIEKIKIKNRKNVTISNIRKIFNKFEMNELISIKNGIFYFNLKNIEINYDLEEFLNEYDKGSKSENESLSLDAIGHYQNCINIYGFYGINNPLKIKEINKYQKALKDKVITASNYIILNKNSAFDEKALSIAKHLTHYNS